MSSPNSDKTAVRDLFVDTAEKLVGETKVEQTSSGFEVSARNASADTSNNCYLYVDFDNGCVKAAFSQTKVLQDERDGWSLFQSLDLGKSVESEFDDEESFKEASNHVAKELMDFTANMPKPLPAVKDFKSELLSLKDGVYIKTGLRSGSSSTINLLERMETEGENTLYTFSYEDANREDETYKCFGTFVLFKDNSKTIEAILNEIESEGIFYRLKF